LKTGKQVWYICGNYSRENAIQLVESTKAKFNLNDVEISELPKVQQVKVPSGTCVAIECPLVDINNDNSCILTFFESSLDNDANKVIANRVVMNFL